MTEKKQSTMRDEREQGGEWDGLYDSDWEPNKRSAGLRLGTRNDEDPYDPAMFTRDVR